MTQTKQKEISPITRKQIILLWTLAGKLGLDRDGVHEAADCASLKHLSSGEAFSLIQKFQSRIDATRKRHSAYRYTPEGRREIWEGARLVLFQPPGVRSVAPAPAKGFQNKIISQVVNYFDSSRGAVTWMKNTFGWERITTVDQAWKVTYALEKMLKRKGHPAAKHTGRKQKEER